MKKMFLVAVAGMFVAMAGKAQVAQFSASGSYLKGAGDNKAELWGGGLGGKFFIGPNFALGGVVHSYPKRSSSVSVNNANYSSSDLITNVAASADLYMSKRTSPVQPYIGVDAGASFNNRIITYSNNSNQVVDNTNKKTYFLLAPKLGINLGIGQAFGIFGQGQYNVTFGDGKDVAINDVPNPFVAKAISKFFTIDAGVYFRLMPAKK